MKHVVLNTSLSGVKHVWEFLLIKRQHDPDYVIDHGFGLVTEQDAAEHELRNPRIDNLGLVYQCFIANIGGEHVFISTRTRRNINRCFPRAFEIGLETAERNRFRFGWYLNVKAMHL